jgi:sec-independent protein translocase protein TatB
MFDIGWTELLILAVVAILIVGPKDLPRMLYTLGQTFGKVRRQADEFRRQFNESMREAGMDDVRNDMKKMSELNPAHQIKDEIESTFSDKPKPASTEKSASDPAAKPSESAAPPSEGDILAQSDALTPAEPARSDTAGEPAPASGHQGPERGTEGSSAPVRSQSANGSAGTERPAPAKDAVN